jgi:hypothetical protein
VSAELVVLALVGAGMVHDRRSAGGVLAGEDEQGAQHGGGLARVSRRWVRIGQCFVTGASRPRATVPTRLGRGIVRQES